MRRALAVVAVALVALVPPATADTAPPSRDFALVGCTVETAAGEPIPDAVVVVREGKIAEVGAAADVKIPKGVARVAAQGKVVTPAFVHVASRIGLRGNGGGGSTNVSPTKTVADELNPWLDGNRWSAANGFATLGLLPGQGIVGGVGAAVRAAADDVASMLRKDAAFVRVDVEQGARFTAGLTGQLSAARKDLEGLEKWEREHAEWEQAQAAAVAAKKPEAEMPKEPKKPTLPDARASLHAVLRGETALLCLVGSSSDVVSLSEALSDEALRGEALRLYCVLSGDSFRAAPALLDLGATCVVRATATSWPNTDHVVVPAVYLRNAGLRVVLMPRDDSRGGLHNYPVDLAGVVSAGFPRGEAVAAATAGAADLLGLHETTGRIEQGLAADLILWSGAPLLATSRLERVWIDGVPVEEVP